MRGWKLPTHRRFGTYVKGIFWAHLLPYFIAILLCFHSYQFRRRLLQNTAIKLFLDTAPKKPLPPCVPLDAFHTVARHKHRDQTKLWLRGHHFLTGKYKHSHEGEGHGGVPHWGGLIVPKWKIHSRQLLGSTGPWFKPSSVAGGKMYWKNGFILGYQNLWLLLDVIQHLRSIGLQ